MAKHRSLSSLREHLQTRLDHVQARSKVPGLGVAMSVEGQRIDAYAGVRRAGDGAPLVAAHRFQLACITKLLLAIVTLDLTRSGVLNLSGTLGRYLEEFRGTLHGDSVRLSHLLAHTGGYRGYDMGDSQSGPHTWEEFTERFSETPRHFIPGSVFSYEPTDTVLLGAILARMTGKDPATLVRRMIFDPLRISPGLTSAGAEGSRCAGRHEFDPAGRRFVWSEDRPRLGELWRSTFLDYTLTLPDLVTIAEAALEGAGKGEGAGPVTAATAKLLQTSAIRLPPAIGGPLSELMPVGFGLGAAEFPGGFWGHNGVSHGQCLALGFKRKKRIAIAVGINAVMPHLRNAMLADAFRLLGGASDAREAPPFAFRLDELEGVYQGGGRRRVVAALGEQRLMLRIGAAGARRALDAELAIDGERAVLKNAPPHLSVAFFRGADREIGCLLGLSAFKRVSHAVP